MWRKENPGLGHKRGDTKAASIVFLCYSRRCVCGEWWVEKSRLDELRAEGRIKRPAQWAKEKAKRRANPLQMEQNRKYHRNYRKKMAPHQKALVRSYGSARRERARLSGCWTKPTTHIKKMYEIVDDMRRRTGDTLEIDHIIPLVHGGKHIEGNLQILDRATNREKSGNPFWMSPDGLSLDWRDVPRHLWPENLRPEYERLIALHPKPVYAIRTKFHRG